MTQVPPGASGIARRGTLRTRFSGREMRRREHARLVGSAKRDLRRTLIERFLLRHLRNGSGPILEIGPGTGRFTSTLLSLRRPTVLLDLSGPMLRTARAGVRRRRPGGRLPCDYVQGAAEALPFGPGRFGAVVLVGVFGFLARDGPLALREAARVLRPDGVVVVETQSATQAMGALFPESPRGARQILRRPKHHYLDRVLAEGYQPFDPPRGANWEFRYWRPAEIDRAVRAAGFRTEDRMAVGAGVGLHAEVVRLLRRDRTAWRNLVRTEERVGRWEEVHGGGATFLLAATRRRGRALRRRTG